MIRKNRALLRFTIAAVLALAMLVPTLAIVPREASSSAITGSDTIIPGADGTIDSTGTMDSAFESGSDSSTDDDIADGDGAVSGSDTDGPSADTSHSAESTTHSPSDTRPLESAPTDDKADVGMEEASTIGVLGIIIVLVIIAVVVVLLFGRKRR